MPIQQTHPLQLGMRVRSKIPTCPCRGTKWKITEGIIKQIKQRQRGGIRKYVYILNNGYKVDQDWINEII